MTTSKGTGRYEWSFGLEGTEGGGVSGGLELEAAAGCREGYGSFEAAAGREWERWRLLGEEAEWSSCWDEGCW